ncbi:methylmalonyl-CoA mutase family protein, partial [Streptomyces massasporeus]
MTVLPDDGLSLAAEFPDATHAQWQRLVEGVLRKSGKEVSGDDAEEALSTTLEDGLSTRPLYTARDAVADTGFPGFAPFVRGGRPEGATPGGWDVRQRHAGGDPARTNEAVLADLENGVTSLWLTVGPGSVPV